MSDVSNPLISKFRANLETRARSIQTLLAQYQDQPTDTEVRHQILGELHTLKGEARMLGMNDLSSLVHVLEEHLLQEDTPEFIIFQSTLDAILLSLSGSTPDSTARLLIRTALAALDQEPISSVPGRPPSTLPPLTSAGSVPEPKNEQQLQRGQRWVQVDATLVDDLCENLMSLSAEMGQLFAKLNRLEAERCQEKLTDCTILAWNLRLTPIEPQLQEIAHHLRSLATERGKQVRVSVQAGAVKIERDVFAQLWDPLLHLARNALDHGLEPPEERGDKPASGTIVFRAETAGPQVLVHIEDDGRGINKELVVERALARGLISPQKAESISESEIFDLLFTPGFSTRTQADDLSGRGIGLDIVKRQISSLGGAIQTQTHPGQGTTFSLSVPATITKERLLIFPLGSVLHAIPARLILAIEQRPRGPQASPVFTFRGTALPLKSLSTLLQIPTEQEDAFVIILQLSERLYAISIPAVQEENEFIRRPVGKLLAQNGCFSASALLPHGELSLVFDPRYLEQLLAGDAPAPSLPQPAPLNPRAGRHVLIADDSPIVRDLITEVLSSAGYEVRAAKNGKEALELLKQQEPGLLVSDVEMPEMDGFELLQAVRQISKTLPIIMLTARGSTEDRRRASTGGANAYVTKGEFKSESLVEVVDRFYPHST